MFRTLIYPSSGACDYSVELPHQVTSIWSFILQLDIKLKVVHNGKLCMHSKSKY